MTKEDIQRIKDAHRIEDVIGHYVSLHRQGRLYRGLCPFHDDRNPSFCVDPAKQTYTCYACGEHGDVLSFVQKIEQGTFAETLGKLDRGVGQLTVRRKPSPAQPPKKEQPSQGVTAELNETFLHSLLPYANGCSELTPVYLDFEVGQSPCMVPAAWKPMSNRIIFPIRNESGLLVAFGARRLTDEKPDIPKYVNSPTSELYKKSETLYGLYQAKEAIRLYDAVYLVEGYKDVLAMHAAGFRNTVALCGTALTDGHIALLRKYTDRVYLLLDADPAGQTACCKMIPELHKADMEVESILLPDGEDPDSGFRRLGKKAFERMIRETQHQPHATEMGLLALCLHDPEATFPFKGEEIRFVDMIYSFLETDGIRFEKEEHWTILSSLVEGKHEAALEEPLCKLAGELHRTYDPQWKEDLEQLREALPEMNDGERLTFYRGKLLFLYAEIRVRRQLRELVRQARRTAGPGMLPNLMNRIADRRELLRHVSVYLQRPGAVW